MKLAIGSDHGGYALKEQLKTWLESQGHQCVDMGCDGPESCDYPLFGAAVGRAVAEGTCERGIAVCTTGIGISIACNKIRGVRCALVGDPLSAQLCRQHNNANVLALGAGLTGELLSRRIVEVFLSTDFEGGRHQRRVDLIHSLEEA